MFHTLAKNVHELAEFPQLPACTLLQDSGPAMLHIADDFKDFKSLPVHS